MAVSTPSRARDPEVAGDAEHRWEPWPAVAVPQSGSRGMRVFDIVALVLVATAGLVFRVLQRSALWLDEALSSNIASLPLGDIPEALRHDGHPPLYYLLLHVWQDVVGDGDVAVRLLSGIIGLALIPLAWVTAGRIGGRRAAWAAALIVTLNPFVLRYSTEARMYELVMVLVLAGWLVADHALRRPALPRLALLAVLTAALLWTHYWGLWLIAASAIGLVGRAVVAHRRNERNRRKASVRVTLALAAGGLLFLPWVPNLLYQAEHTATPWGEPSIPTEVAALSLIDLGGGLAGESILLAVALCLLVALGLFGAPGSGTRIELDLRTRPEVRRIAVIVVATLALAAGVSYAAGTAYATRYFSVVAPLVLVLAGVGAARVGGAVAFRVVLAGVLIMGTASAVRTAVSRPRTQADVIADAITSRPGSPASDALVLVCPDQLVPSVSRALPGVEVHAYPDGPVSDPPLVDWVDYEERLEQDDPADVAASTLSEAGDRDVWLVWSGTYRTHEGTCEAVANELQRRRPDGRPVVLSDPDAYESANAYFYPATSGSG